MDLSLPTITMCGTTTMAGALIGWILLLEISLVCSNEVHLMYRQKETIRDNFPTYVNISINSTTEGLNKLQLTKILDDRLNIPLFVKGKDSNGKEFHRRENLADKKDTTFYVDKSTGTLIQLTKTGNMKDLKPELKRGLFSLGGRRYKMNGKQKSLNKILRHNSIHRTSSLDDSVNTDDVDDTYDVMLEPEDIGSTYDFLLPPHVDTVVNKRPQARKPQSVNSLFDNSSSPMRPVDPEHMMAPTNDDSNDRHSMTPPAIDPRARTPMPPTKTHQHPMPPTKTHQHPIPPQETDPRSRHPIQPHEPRHSLHDNVSEPRGPSARHRRDTTVYYIDTVAVIDYSLYQRFLDSAGSRNQALEDIREYYAFLFTGVDLRYEGITGLSYTITIKLVKIVVLETIFDSSITEQFRVMKSGARDQLDATDGLTAFKEWVVASGSSLVTPYDHAALFTYYDLTRTLDGVVYTSTAGLAYTSTMCRTDGVSVSIIEDKGAYQTMFTVAHEIGHGLSAYHDGDGNECNSNDDYVMAGGLVNGNDNTRLNPWVFSSCSVDYFRSFITDKLSTSAGLKCLAETQSISSDIPNVEDELLGQQSSPDDQCRAIYGSGSYLCRSQLDTPAEVCTKLYCSSSDDTLCYKHVAARGTSCGDGKICLEGQCVSDPRAPALDESCPFGDQPGTTFFNLTCPELIDNFGGYCYQSVIINRCCASCKAIYNPVVDCLYGDKASNCKDFACSSQGDDYKSDCCGTCNYGEPLATTATSTTTTPTTTTSSTTTTTLSTTTSTPSTTTTTPSTTTTTTTTTESTTTTTTTTTSTTTSTPESCTNSPSGVDGQSCSSAINQQPYLCYTESVLQMCCAACKQAETQYSDCMYGDRTPSDCSWRDDIYSCLRKDIDCCDTCRVFSASPPMYTSYQLITAIVFVALCLFIL